MSSHAEARARAADAAHRHIRHLLYPETVHLLTVADIADALTVANDILAPGERQAAQQLPGVCSDLQREHRRYLAVAGQRDDAVTYADTLAYAVGELVGRDLRPVEPGPKLWNEGLSILDEIADANSRPRPSRRKRRIV